MTFAVQSKWLSILKITRRTALVVALSIGFAQVAYADLAVSMSITTGYPNPIYPGDITSFHITLTNSDPAATLTNAAFTDTLGPSLLVAGGGLTNYSCKDGSGVSVATTGAVTATIGTGTISLAGGTVPQAVGGTSGECDIDVEVTSTDQNQSPVNNIAAAAVTGMDGGVGVSNADPAQQSVTVNSLNPPTITKSFSRGTIVKSDQTVHLTITISNSANATKNLPLNTAANSPAWAIHDTLPAGLQVATTPNATSTCTGAGVAITFAPAAGDTTLVGQGGTVAAGGSCSVAVDLVGTDTGGGYSKSVTNTINHTTDFGNQRGLAAAADATASLTIQSALQVSKAFNPTTVAAGQTAPLTITLTNASPLNALP
jgi:hypothetical protein